ncbi:response regulator [Arcobacter sp. LA11]|uniref:response regulator n=1 Tax=Arcobacter sp. LA11 TaxID=1898176 RepID=UPI00093344D9|nr:response regulator [Arcobacter sp. LA11]
MSVEVLKKLNVLYVEDEEEVSCEVIHNLKFFVNDIISCENGQEGLDVYINEKDSIDIIITDVLMPVLDGKKMVDEIRKINPTVPVVFTTAFNNSEFLEYTQTQDLVENISKPIDLEELFQIIIKLINK